MAKSIYKAVLLAGGLAMATAVIAQMPIQMRTPQTASPISQLQMAAPTSGDFAQLKAKLNADEAAIGAMKAQLEKLQTNFANHTHSLKAGDLFVPVVKCASASSGYDAAYVTCKSLQDTAGSGAIGDKVWRMPLDTAKPTY